MAAEITDYHPQPYVAKATTDPKYKTTALVRKRTKKQKPKPPQQPAD
jgi:hypothetical protein